MFNNMNIFDQIDIKEFDYQYFIEFELNHMIFNFFVKMSISGKYIENLWTDTEFFSFFVSESFLTISCSIMKKIFNSKSNAAITTEKLTFEKNSNIVSMQDVHDSMRYVFENIEIHVSSNSQIMIIIQNTIRENIQKNVISNYETIFRQNIVFNQYSIPDTARKKSITTVFKNRKSASRKKLTTRKLFDRKKRITHKNRFSKNFFETAFDFYKWHIQTNSSISEIYGIIIIKTDFRSCS